MQQFTKQLVRQHRLFDIAANLTDQQFQKHQDRDQVVQRATAVGCTHLLIAAGSLEDAKESYQLSHRYANSYCTIGVHPCRASEPFDLDKHQSLESYFGKVEQQAVLMKDRLVAVGECGLDYDRLNYSSKEQQLAVFVPHFELAEKLKLPMYLHNRNTGEDFYQLVKQNRHRFSSGVVHSFTGSLEEVKQILELDLFIGINGCSLKTPENVAVLREIPLDRIMLETDSPYCEIRPSHQGSKWVKDRLPLKNKPTPDYLLKGRNEPCRILEVLQAVSAIRGVSPEDLSEIAFKNAVKLFGCPE